MEANPFLHCKRYYRAKIGELMEDRYLVVEESPTAFKGVLSSAHCYVV